jgi:hypothetical protein
MSRRDRPRHAASHSRQAPPADAVSAGNSPRPLAGAPCLELSRGAEPPSRVQEGAEVAHVGVSRAIVCGDPNGIGKRLSPSRLLRLRP